jgi:hypothetical protein
MSLIVACLLVSHANAIRFREEVERAARLLNDIGAGKNIVKVDTTEDAIVYSGVTHTDFVSLFL